MTLIYALEESQMKRKADQYESCGVCLECSSGQMEFRNDLVIRDQWGYESGRDIAVLVAIYVHQKVVPEIETLLNMYYLLIKNRYSVAQKRRHANEFI